LDGLKGVAHLRLEEEWDESEDATEREIQGERERVSAVLYSVCEDVGVNCGRC